MGFFNDLYRKIMQKIDSRKTDWHEIAKQMDEEHRIKKEMEDNAENQDLKEEMVWTDFKDIRLDKND